MMENRVTWNDTLTISCPEGFHVMDEEERSRLNFYGEGECECLSDPDRHIIISIGWARLNGLGAAATQCTSEYCIVESYRDGEALYRLAQAYFDAGNVNAAEKEVLDYIEVSTPHTYWLARSFILLSDVYKKMGKTLDARQYLLSLQQNYQANDDIADMIRERLNQLDNKQ